MTAAAVVLIVLALPLVGCQSEAPPSQPATRAVAAAPKTLVQQVRALIAAGDVAGAETLVESVRKARGQTPEWLEAYSWVARGHLAAERDADAERHALKTYDIARSMLETRPMDAEPKLPIAYGAAVEVLGQIEARRGARTDAVLFLEREREAHKGTSVEKRIQKNINLLSLEGTKAPALTATEHLGRTPPSLDELQGKVVLLFFWAHWCSDCKAMAPVLADLDARYRGDGLVIVAPTQRYGYVQGGAEASAELETPYIDRVRRQYYAVLADAPVPLDAANHLRYGVSSTPTVVLVDRAGVIRLYHPGQMTMAAIEPRIRALLAGQPAES